jgi:hypothetical protein
MNFIDKLESKYGRFGVPDLMRYIIGINVVGIVLNLLIPGFYAQYLSLDVYRILHGQIWRLFTFVLDPVYSVSSGASALIDIFWFAIWAFVYYSIGQSLERTWGTFRFTLFMLFGWLFILVVTFVSYFAMGPLYGSYSKQMLSYVMAIEVTLGYLYKSLFLAFALMFPDMQFLIYFIIPVKAKWLALVYLLLDGYTVVVSFVQGDYFTVALVLGAVANVLLFYVFGRGRSGVKGAYQQKKRKDKFKRKVRQSAPEFGGTVHRCAICGRTEKDAPGLEFRYCSKCEGNYEYCSDHLFTHEHVHH